MVKTDLDNYSVMLNEVIKLCQKVKEIQDADLTLQILIKCQETVITVGENLEKNCNKKDKDAIKNLHIIKRLEEFCELDYKFSNSIEITLVDEMMDVIKGVLRDINKIPRTYRVVFLPYKAAMWDSLESIWKEFAVSDECETSVVPIPYFEANRKTNQWDTCYEGDKYPENVPVVHFQDYLLGQKKPDLVFVHNPFDQFNNVTTVHPAYYSAELRKSCGKIVYVPYYVNPGFISEDYNELPLLYRSDYIIVQSEKAKETCKGFPYYDRILPLGSPKFDKVINLYNKKTAPPEEWNINLDGKKCILLNTTLTDFLESGELLINKLYKVFKIALSRKDIVVVWRPHPLLKGTVKAMRPQYIEKYDELVQYFIDNNVGVYDKTADVSRAVAVSDAYVGSHYSSIIALFEVLDKPVFRIDSKEFFDRNSVKNRERANAVDVFNKTEERSYFGCFESMNYTLEDFLDDLVGDNLYEVIEKQKKEADIAVNLDGTCGRKVYQYMLNILKNG